MSNKATSVGVWLKENAEKLLQTGVNTARLDCLVLLGDLLGKDKSYILSHPETKLSDDDISILENQIAQRSRHIPLAYIRGKSEFYGREFLVNEHVLEPRPESEAIIDSLKLVASEVGSAIDVGTGSGALAITAKFEHPDLHVIALDIDPSCLEIAKANARTHKARVSFQESNLLEGLEQSKLARSLLLANLPYVPDGHTLNKAATHEPKLAIFGGKDGLDLYRTLFSQVDGIPNKPLFIIAESLLDQHADLEQIAQRHSYTLEHTNGLVQLYKLT